MPFMDSFYHVFSETRKTLNHYLHNIWDSYYVQSMVQGVGAPWYGYEALKILDHIPDLNSLALLKTEEEKENYRLAAHTFKEVLPFSINSNLVFLSLTLAGHFIYYRLIHPLCDAENNFFSNQEAAMVAFAFDYCVWLALPSYLFYLWTFNVSDNFTNTQTITDTAKVILPPSKNYKPCAHPDGFAASHSIVFYALNRYITNTISYSLTQYNPGNLGEILSFILESFSFGYPLVEYKLDVVGTCTKDRVNQLLRNNKLFLFWYGASYVACIRIANAAFNSVTGSPGSFFFNDSITSLLFQLYALFAMVKTEPLPGGNEKKIDILAMIYKLSEYISSFSLSKKLKNLLQKSYSPEELMKRQSVGLWMRLKYKNIKKHCADYAKTVETLETLEKQFWFSTLFNVGKNFITIPDGVNDLKTFFKKGYLSNALHSVDYYTNLAYTHEEERSIQKIVKKPIKDQLAEYIKNSLKDAPAKPTTIIRETDSDDEWVDDFVDVLKNEDQKITTTANKELIHEEYFPEVNAVTENKNKEKILNHHRLFQNLIPERKILKDKNLAVVTGLLVTETHASSKLKRF